MLLPGSIVCEQPAFVWRRVLCGVAFCVDVCGVGVVVMSHLALRVQWAGGLARGAQAAPCIVGEELWAAGCWGC